MQQCLLEKSMRRLVRICSIYCIMQKTVELQIEVQNTYRKFHSALKMEKQCNCVQECECVKLNFEFFFFTQQPDCVVQNFFKCRQISDESSALLNHFPMSILESNEVDELMMIKSNFQGSKNVNKFLPLVCISYLSASRWQYIPKQNIESFGFQSISAYLLSIYPQFENRKQSRIRG